MTAAPESAGAARAEIGRLLAKPGRLTAKERRRVEELGWWADRLSAARAINERRAAAGLDLWPDAHAR